MQRQRAPAGYTYRTKNNVNITKGLCDGCTECAVSYPNGDPLMWKSAEKLLRCRGDSETSYVYGWHLDHCGNKYDQDCGADCMHCLWSYPTGDPDGFGSSNAKCRCPPTAIKELTWGDRCPSPDLHDCGSYCRDCQRSWKTYEEADQIGVTEGRCRCKNWY